MLRFLWHPPGPRVLLVLLMLLIVGLEHPHTLAPPTKVVTPHSAPLPLRRPVPSSSVPTPSSDCVWLAVAIDNSIPAWPQAGLSEASIVYELPAEGGITRLLAFFCEGAPQVVGPVRSVRTHMLEIARDYGAVVAHSGQSASAFAMIARGTVPVINEFWESRPFWRDARRRMPHNLYTSVPRLRRYIRGPQAVDTPHWTSVDTSPAPNPQTIFIPYGPGYDVRFEYDPELNGYRRFIGGRATIDAGTDTPITVASVIVQYVRWWQTHEDQILESRLDLTGSGPLTVFTDGRRIDGRWQRGDAQQRTTFTDLQGQPLSLQAGPTWVNIVPVERSVRVLRARPQWRTE